MEQFVHFLQEESTSSSLKSSSLKGGPPASPSPSSPSHTSVTGPVSTAVAASTRRPSTPDSPKPWKYGPQTVTLTGSSFHLVPAASTPMANSPSRGSESEPTRPTVVASSQDTDAPSVQTQTLLEVLGSPESSTK